MRYPLLSGEGTFYPLIPCASPRKGPFTGWMAESLYHHSFHLQAGEQGLRLLSPEHNFLPIYPALFNSETPSHYIIAEKRIRTTFSRIEIFRKKMRHKVSSPRVTSIDIAVIVPKCKSIGLYLIIS